MKWWARDITAWRDKTCHLSLLERGIYGELLDRYYRADGGLPDGEAEVCRAIGAMSPPERRATRRILADFFPEGRNARADAEIARAQAKADASRRNGAQSGGRKPGKTRLPEDWKPSMADFTFAMKEGFADTEIHDLGKHFAQYWSGQSGARGLKSNWTRAWNEWVRKERRSRTGAAPRARAGARNRGAEQTAAGLEVLRSSLP